MTNMDAQTLEAEVLNLPGLTIRYITPLSNSDNGCCVLKVTFSPGVVPIYYHPGYETLVAAARRTSAHRIDGDTKHLSILGRVVRSVSAWRARASSYAAERQSLSCLTRLDDHTLRDIGLNHADLTARWTAARDLPRIPKSTTAGRHGDLRPHAREARQPADDDPVDTILRCAPDNHLFGN